VSRWNPLNFILFEIFHHHHHHGECANVEMDALFNKDPKTILNEQCVKKIAIFWDVAPCSLVEVYRRFRGACCLIALMIEAENTSETWVNFYQTTLQSSSYSPP
jgi:DNA gyrase inhibitor GyrI